jgi:hypothetical protein
VVDLDGAGDLHDGLVEKALERNVLAREPADVDQDAHVPAQLGEVGGVARPGCRWFMSGGQRREPPNGASAS